ncbi:hypothetical protein J7411_20805, partial [Xanthomonas phaseoli pv. dieffenbachiae]|nr:hypothetical protein [Xanthomonas phaseoli pv. dieffenbachiae]
EIPAESARNGEIPKFQKPLFGTTPPSALSGLVVQTFPNFRTIAAGKATTMGHIQRKHLADAKVAVPPTDAMSEFDHTIAPLFEQIINNALQSRTLAQQRDILLPKLISGEFRVRDVKCFLEKAK